MQKVIFTLKEEHIKLIGNLNFRVCAETEYGDPFIPEINRKRPFGNSGAVSDVLDILGYEPDEEGNYKEEDTSRAESLLIELPLALEAVVTNKTFTPGDYEMERCGAYSQYQLMRNYKALQGAVRETEEMLRNMDDGPQRIRMLRELCMNVSGDDPWEVIQYIELGKCASPFWDNALAIFRKHKAMSQQYLAKMDLCVRCIHNVAAFPTDFDCGYACTGVIETADEGRIVLSCDDYQERG